MKADRQRETACYPSGGSKPLMIAGYALIVVGVILLFCCIPGWAWCALIGVGLVALGWLLVNLNQGWR